MSRFVVLDGNWAMSSDSMEKAKECAIELAKHNHSIVKIIDSDGFVCDIYAIDENGATRKVSE